MYAQGKCIVFSDSEWMRGQNGEGKLSGENEKKEDRGKRRRDGIAAWRKETGGGTVLCWMWKGQLDSLQAGHRRGLHGTCTPSQTHTGVWVEVWISLSGCQLAHQLVWIRLYQVSLKKYICIPATCTHSDFFQAVKISNGTIYYFFFFSKRRWALSAQSIAKAKKQKEDLNNH